MHGRSQHLTMSPCNSHAHQLYLDHSRLPQMRMFIFSVEATPPTRARWCSLIPRPSQQNTGFGMRLAQAPLNPVCHAPGQVVNRMCLSWKFSFLAQCCKQWLIQQYIYNTSHISIWWHIVLHILLHIYYIHVYSPHTMILYTCILWYIPLVHATECIRCAHTVTEFLYLLSPWLGTIGQLAMVQESV